MQQTRSEVRAEETSSDLEELLAAAATEPERSTQTRLWIQLVVGLVGIAVLIGIVVVFIAAFSPVIADVVGFLNEKFTEAILL